MPVVSKFLPCNNPLFPIPAAVEPRFRLHIEDVRVQFEKDLKEGGGYVRLRHTPLPHRLSPRAPFNSYFQIRIQMQK